MTTTTTSTATDREAPRPLLPEGAAQKLLVESTAYLALGLDRGENLADLVDECRDALTAAWAEILDPMLSTAADVAVRVAAKLAAAPRCADCRAPLQAGKGRPPVRCGKCSALRRRRRDRRRKRASK